MNTYQRLLAFAHWATSEAGKTYSEEYRKALLELAKAIQNVAKFH